MRKSAEVSSARWQLQLGSTLNRVFVRLKYMRAGRVYRQHPKLLSHAHATAVVPVEYAKRSSF